MHAILLAGGKGSRLASLTAVTPKVLLPINGTPVIERIILQLREQGVFECTVVIGHLAEAVKSHLGSGDRLGVQIQYLREARPLDTAGCLGQLSLSEPFLLINGDVVTDFRFTDLARSRQQANCAASIAVRRHSLHVDFGVLQCDEDGRMSDCVEKPTYDLWLNMGIYCFHPSVCRLVAPGERVSMPQILLRLRDAGHMVQCHRTDCYWCDIGRPADYFQARRDLETGLPPAITRHAA